MVKFSLMRSYFICLNDRVRIIRYFRFEIDDEYGTTTPGKLYRTRVLASLFLKYINIHHVTPLIIKLICSSSTQCKSCFLFGQLVFLLIPYRGIRPNFCLRLMTFHIACVFFRITYTNWSTRNKTTWTISV